MFKHSLQKNILRLFWIMHSQKGIISVTVVCALFTLEAGVRIYLERILPLLSAWVTADLAWYEVWKWREHSCRTWVCPGWNRTLFTTACGHRNCIGTSKWGCKHYLLINFHVASSVWFHTHHLCTKQASSACLFHYSLVSEKKKMNDFTCLRYLLGVWDWALSVGPWENEGVPS